MSRIVKSTILSLLLLVFTPGLSWGQVKEDPVKSDQAGQRDAVFNELRSGATNDKRVEQFLREYYLARWTIQANAKDIHNYRKELIADSASLSDQGRKVFYTLVVKILTNYAVDKDRYPACRYNAILAMGTLDEKPASGANPPVPFSGVLKRLCNFCDSDKVQLPDYVRLGALVGIVRQTELGIKDEEQRKLVHSLLLKILSPQYVQEKKYRKEIMTWFQLKAMEGLVNMKTAAGPKGATETLDAFRVVIEDTKKDIEVRCLAARGIGRIKMEGLKDYDTVGLANSIATLARDFCSEEITFIAEESLRDQIRGDSNASMGSEMGAPSSDMGGMTGGTAPNSNVVEKTNNIIARIKFDLDSVQNAIAGIGEKNGVKAALSEKQKDSIELLDGVSKIIKETLTFLDSGPADTVTAPVRTKGKKKGATGPAAPKVNIAQIKDHLGDQVAAINSLLGIETL